MKARHSKFLAVSFASLGLWAISVQAALFPSQALNDHTLCCGTGVLNAGANLHAISDFSSRSGLNLAVVAASPVSGAAAASPAPARVSPGAVAVPDAGVKVTEIGKLEKEDGYFKVGFDRLAAYTFKVPPFDPAATPDVKPPTGEEQIPGWLKDLNGQKAMVTGFMLPIKMEGNLVTEFLLLSDPMMCCYGAVPEMNQWIVVKMKKGGVRPIQDLPISFYGDLKVGAMFENGYMTGIYSMDCDKMGAVQG